MGLDLRNLWQPVATCGDGVRAPKEKIAILEYSRLGILEAWRLGFLDWIGVIGGIGGIGRFFAWFPTSFFEVFPQIALFFCLKLLLSGDHSTVFIQSEITSCKPVSGTFRPPEPHLTAVAYGFHGL